MLSSTYPDSASRLLGSLAGDPLDVLVATVLSQNTNDTLSARTFRRLKGRFPSWDMLLEAPDEELTALLSGCGLQRQKARTLKSAVAKLLSDFGAVTLEPLRRMSADEAFKYLRSLSGIGPKTAACVLAFGLGMPAFPVDTHVLRVVHRLGLVNGRRGAAKVQETLEAETPPGAKLLLHVTLIEHGRRICTPRRPRCEECPLSEMCDYFIHGGKDGTPAKS